MAGKVSLGPNAKYLPFLVEIRRRLFFLVSLFAISSIVGFIYYEKIIRFILGIFHFEGVNIVFTSPFQFINLAIQSSFLVGLVVIFPVIIIQVLGFLKPALRPKEFRTIIVLLPFSLVLFITGFSYGVMVMQWTLQLFYRQTQGLGVGNFLDISALLSSILSTAILLGVAFQFPLVLILLMRLKIIKQAMLEKRRIFVHAFFLLFAALLPPTDLLSLVLLFLPLALMFELTLLLNRMFFRQH